MDKDGAGIDSAFLQNCANLHERNANLSAFYKQINHPMERADISDCPHHAKIQTIERKMSFGIPALQYAPGYQKERSHCLLTITHQTSTALPQPSREPPTHPAQAARIASRCVPKAEFHAPGRRTHPCARPRRSGRSCGLHWPVRPAHRTGPAS